MDTFAELTGRAYHLFDYVGAPRGRARHRHDGLGRRDGARDGRLADRQRREGRRAQGPPVPALLASSTSSRRCRKTVKAIAVLDRTKEPGAIGEPLYLDVVTALREAQDAGTLAVRRIRAVIGGRYGLSSKEFTPAMVKAVFDELAKPKPEEPLHRRHHRRRDAHSRSPYDPDFDIEPADVVRARVLRPRRRRHGRRQQELDQDHRRGDRQLRPGLLRLRLEEGRRDHRSRTCASARSRSARRYLITQANFVACHQFVVPREVRHARATPRRAASFLLNARSGRTRSGTSCRARCRQQIIEKKLKFYVIDAYEVAKETGMGARINTIMQTCFFAISGVLPRDEAIAQIKKPIKKTYGRRARRSCRRTSRPSTRRWRNLHEVKVPGRGRPATPHDAADRVRRGARVRAST